MSLEAEFSKEQIQQKLVNLEQHLPKEAPELYTFAKYLAENLSERVGWHKMYLEANAELLLAELEHGFDLRTQGPLYGYLTTLSAEKYGLLRGKIECIVDIVYGKENLRGVEDF